VTDPDVATYYADRHVAARLREYCGVSVADVPGAVYLATIDAEGDPHVTWESPRRFPIASLPSLLEATDDIARSLWDTRHLVWLIDLDHQNLDTPAHPFLRPDEAFVALEPTFRAVRAICGELDLPVMSVMTGRGYHFTGVIPLTHPVVQQLAALMPGTPRWWYTHERRRASWMEAPLPDWQARAHAGLGLVTEYLAHLVLDRAAPASAVPVTVNGTVVGAGAHGREAVSLDFSHFGDPLDVRQFRTCFSAYQWHRLRPDIFGAAAALPALAAIPRDRETLAALLRQGRRPRVAAAKARRATAWLPDLAGGVERLVDRYQSSSLAAFHRHFYAERASAATFDDAPPCVSWCLDQPNDRLLKPEHLQHLARWGLANGRTARQLADAVAERYEADHGWGDRWRRLDPRTRAEFDIRVFAGFVATGDDRLVDFNCVSAQQKDVCPRVGCPHDLRLDRDRLTAGGRR
jgi:hypothetical protein